MIPNGYHYEATLVSDGHIGKDARFSEWINALDLLKAIAKCRFPYIAAAFLTGYVFGLLSA